jgi:hypothetical protein
MTNREHFETVLNGGIPDRIPAVFRLDIWHKTLAKKGNLPPELKGMSLEQVEKFLGLGRSARKGKVHETRLRLPVECIKSRNGELLITEWRTPGRALRMVQQFGLGDEAAGISPATIEYPIKSIEDYAAYEAIMKHTEFISAYEEYFRYDQMIGEDGLPMIILGANPFHDLFLRWTGYERGFMDLFDRPDVFLQAVETANNVYRQMWEIVANSPARLVMHGVNFDVSMTPPTLFRNHFLPYFKDFNREMHLHRKKVAFHGDGELTGLLDEILKAGYDVADCFACEPMVKCTLAQARLAWKDRITIWGGIPSILLEPNVPLGKLQTHLENIRNTVGPGKNFILGIADQAMPTASWEHIKLAAGFLQM